MEMLKRIRQSDVDKSDTLYRLAVQAYIAGETGQVSAQTSDEILAIVNRAHTSLLITSGVLARAKQRRYNDRNPLIKTKYFNIAYNESLITQVLLGVGFGLVFLLAYVVI